MKNETTGVEEFFVTPEVSEDTEDVVLMSDTEVLEAATVIAQVTASDEKFPFYLHYDANQKEFLLSVLTAAGATIESDDVDNHILSVRMNMTQMKLVRYQDCVERVRTDEGMNTMLADEVIDEDLDAEIIPVTAEDDNDDLVNTSNLDNTAEASSSARAMMLSEDEVMPAVAGEVAMTANNTEPRSTCCCPTNTTMETAKTITVESLISGYICCPGTPQWFKFTVPQTAKYTIYTTGDKDTRGALYGSNGQRITHVDDYEPCGKVNFRIIQELQANETYYVRVDIAKSGTGNYQLKVTQKTLVNKVNITPNLIVLDVGKTYELPRAPQTYAVVPGATCINNFGVTVSPSDADEQRILWSISGNSNGICSMTSGWHKDKPYTTLTTVKEGIITLRAYDWFEHGQRGECTVYVGGAPVTGISMDRTTKIVGLNDPEQLTASIAPSNARNKGIIWTSSNYGVVDVDNDGWITGLKAGTATVTATTIDGNYSTTCAVRVDRREKVSIVKDGNYFNIIFNDGKVWENVGRDLSLPDNQSGNLSYGYIEWDNLYEWEQRFYKNFQNSYTVDQLAYIYFFDPLGVENYMVNIQAPIYKNHTTLECLNFKDSLYSKIFGTIPNKFYFNDDGVYSDYQNYQGWNRLNYHSNAEILFGWHRTPFNWMDVIKAGVSALFDIVIGSVPPISFVQNGVTLYKYAFYGASISDFSATLLTSYLSLYEMDPIIWAISLLSAITDATFSQFEIPNDMTVDVYHKVESLDNYVTVFTIGKTEVSMGDVITHC